jgi:acetolactate synthase-1/3 small subunit
MKQLNKLIDVIRVSDIPPEDSVNRELALIKVGVDSTTRAEVMQIVDIFRAKIVDVGVKSLIVEVTGDDSKINAIEQLLRQFGVKEMVRTGKVAMNRGAKVVQSEKK